MSCQVLNETVSDAQCWAADDFLFLFSFFPLFLEHLASLFKTSELSLALRFLQLYLKEAYDFFGGIDV